MAEQDQGLWGSKYRLRMLSCISIARGSPSRAWVIGSRVGGRGEDQQSWAKEKQGSQACTTQVEHASCQPASLNTRGSWKAGQGVSGAFWPESSTYPKNQKQSSQ